MGTQTQGGAATLPELFHGDCLELMQNIPDNSVDMILTDPPYSSGGTFAGDRKKSTGVKYTDTGFNGAASLPDFSGDNMDQRIFTEFMRMVFARARKKTKPSGIIAAFVDWRNLPALSDALQAAGWTWRGVVVWDKKNSRPQMGRYRNVCEFVVWGSNGALPTDRGVLPLPGLYTYANVATQKRNHQTEKPVQLMEDLLEIVPSGARVLDMFMGSGSTGVACINTGREFIGIELSEYYYKVAQERIKKAIADKQ